MKRPAKHYAVFRKRGQIRHLSRFVLAAIWLLGERAHRDAIVAEVRRLMGVDLTAVLIWRKLRDLCRGVKVGHTMGRLPGRVYEVKHFYLTAQGERWIERAFVCGWIGGRDAGEKDGSAICGARVAREDDCFSSEPGS